VPDLLSESIDQNPAELSNDQLLWTPPFDANNEENSILVNKYLKQAAKECSLKLISVFVIGNTFIL